MIESSRDPQIFEPEYYRRLREVEATHWWAAGMREAMDALISSHLPSSIDRVLDVGCGTGFLLSYLKRYAPGKQPVGIDLSGHGLRYARESSSVQVSFGSATTIPFCSSSFGLITCIDTLQHLPQGTDMLAIREMSRVLRKEGILYIRTNSSRGHAHAAATSDYRRYELATVSGMLENEGLEVLRATYLNVLPGFWGMIKEGIRREPAHHDHSAPGLAIRPYPVWLRPVNAALTLLSKGEATLLRTGISYRFGHSSAFVARKP